MTTLADRVTDIQVIEAWIAEHADEIAAAQGELPPELEALLNEGMASLEEKVERVALVIKRMWADSTANEQLEKHYAGRRRVKANEAERLEGYLYQQLQAAGITHVKRPLADVAIQQSPASVTSSLDEVGLRNLAQHRPSLVKHTEVWSLDKEAVKRAALLAEPLPEGVSITRNTHIRIR